MTYLMLCEPLWILVWEAMEQILDADHVKQRVTQKLEPLIARDLDPRRRIRRMFERRAQQSGVLETIAQSLEDLVGEVNVNRVRSLGLISRLRIRRKVVRPTFRCVIFTINESSDCLNRHVETVLPTAGQ